MPIAGYHSTNRNATILSGVNMQEPGLLGLEIEVDFARNRGKHVEAALEAGRGKIIAETDCSLNGHTGVEFIFAPLTLPELTMESFVGRWCEAVHAKARGWTKQGYGMHISVNANPMRNLEAGKFAHFVNTHKVLCEKVGGRPHYFYNQFYGNRTSEQPRLEAYNNSTGRHLAACRNGSRIEVRLFQSAVNFDRILRNCQFCDSVRIFTKQAAVEDLTDVKYLNWLGEHADNYQALASRLLTRVSA